MFNSLRTAAAKFTRISGSGSGRHSSVEEARDSGAQLPEQIASAEQADTLGNFQSFPRRSSISRDKGRNSVEGSKPYGCASSSGSKVQTRSVALTPAASLFLGPTLCRVTGCRAQKLLQAARVDAHPPM